MVKVVDIFSVLEYERRSNYEESDDGGNEEEAEEEHRYC
jgi:hypothetical protein